MTKKYDRIKARNYARKWALSHNPEFYHYGGIGGDCTNFISQCLLAGGAVMNFSEYGWFYRDTNNHSASWTAVKYLREFLLSNTSRGARATIQDISNLQVGDIIQLRQNKTHFNHTVIVTQILQNDILVCAHSNDALDKRLSDYYFEELLGLHIEEIQI